MKLLNHGYWLAILATGLALWGAYQWTAHTAREEGRAEIQTKWDEATRIAKEKADQTEADWLVNVQAQKELRDEEVKRLTAARDDALRELRNRPARADLSEVAPSTCQSGTGANLYRDDAELLTRESARADELRAALGQCQAWIETVTHQKDR